MTVLIVLVNDSLTVLVLVNESLTVLIVLVIDRAWRYSLCWSKTELEGTNYAVHQRSLTPLIVLVKDRA